MGDPNLTEFFNSKITVWCTLTSSLSKPTGMCFNALSSSLPLPLASHLCFFTVLLPHRISLICSCLCTFFFSFKILPLCMSVCHVLPDRKGIITSSIQWLLMSFSCTIHSCNINTPFFSLLKTKRINILGILHGHKELLMADPLQCYRNYYFAIMTSCEAG